MKSVLEIVHLYVRLKVNAYYARKLTKDGFRDTAISIASCAPDKELYCTSDVVIYRSIQYCMTELNRAEHDEHDENLLNSITWLMRYYFPAAKAIQ